MGLRAEAGMRFAAFRSEDKGKDGGTANVPTAKGLDGAINVKGAFDRAKREGTGKQEKPKS